MKTTNNKMKAMFLYLVITAIVMSCISTFAFAAGKGMDVIIAVDDTRSMQTTDPNKLSSVAINKFVEKLPAEADVRLGITTYSIDVMPGSLELGQTPEAIKTFSNSNLTQDGRGTDAAVGLDWAVNELLNKSDDSRRKVIVLIGDGENSYIVSNQAVRTDEDSNAMLNNAIANAQSKGIEVYTLAMNPTADNFRQYFSNIASATGGKSYEPKSPEDLDGIMDDVFTTVTGANMVNSEPIALEAGQPITKEITVPSGVFEMNLQCDYEKPLEIFFTDPNGTTYNENSDGVVYSQENSYSNFKIHEPMEGQWTVTYKSDTPQTITPQFVFHADVAVSLSKNQNEIMQKKPVQYIATVSAQGKEITDDSNLAGFDAVLVVEKTDDNGNVKKELSQKMEIKNGKFIGEYAIDAPGKYQVHAELVGEKSSIKSNILSIDVLVDPTIIPPRKIVIFAIALILILIILILVLKKLTGRAGSGKVLGYVSIAIKGSKSDGSETVSFQQDRFDCEQIFTKKNNLTDLINEYKKRYLINNPSDLSRFEVDHFINSSLTKVSDAILICGNKKKQTILIIPAKFEMMMDDMKIKKSKTLIFNSKECELQFENDNIKYTINLDFSR